MYDPFQSPQNNWGTYGEDGENYEKYDGNPVIQADALPKGAGKFDFRDPKVFMKNGKYYMVVGNKTEDKPTIMETSSSGLSLTDTAWSFS